MLKFKLNTKIIYTFRIYPDILQEFFIRISYYVNHNFWIYSKNFISKNDWPNSPRKDKIFIVKTMLQDLSSLRL